ncbi:putative signal transducing protein [Seonamhaeicola aphaedonensis]|uniref:Putative signal transducing protein n=1 Tax=Seonamhaeicola aphaedonensis TaxID=1461338 RepID=A0A3D9HIJ3_9FLAO|nr:DUF2007 domain-containing protein [Seonamhaeicola aphaedonensis]RED49278.1 putative signal transducing protein [Seonamhaeicola aphaedonensis]
MTDSNYIKVFTGDLIIVQRIINELEKVSINPIVKDQTDSGIITDILGSSASHFQEIYVHNDELDKAVLIIEEINSELQA